MSVTEAEILYGVETLPPGKRRLRLLAAVEKMFAEEFAGRILTFDEDAARAFAKIVAARNAAGRPIAQFDAMIAAIARAHRAAVATRNTADFQSCGIGVIKPWVE
jgi:predicted nucleic acid-binding protein